MKKIYCVCLLCGWLVLSLNSQAQKTRLGVVAGTNYSLDNRVMDKMHLGASAGMFVEVLFKNHIFLKGEATYLIKQRANLSQTENGKPNPYTIGAWQFPVNVGYRFHFGQWQPYLQGGAFVHSAQNSLGKNRVGLSLEGRHQEYIRPTAGVGLQWRKIALELEWQIGQRVRREDFFNWNSQNVNFFGIVAGGCYPYPYPYPNYFNTPPSSVRNDSFLLKFRYYFN